VVTSNSILPKGRFIRDETFLFDLQLIVEAKVIPAAMAEPVFIK
jgi:hypothetical protein